MLLLLTGGLLAVLEHMQDTVNKTVTAEKKRLHRNTGGLRLLEAARTRTRIALNTVLLPRILGYDIRDKHNTVDVRKEHYVKIYYCLGSNKAKDSLVPTVHPHIVSTPPQSPTICPHQYTYPMT